MANNESLVYPRSPIPYRLPHTNKKPRTKPGLFCREQAFALFSDDADERVLFNAFLAELYPAVSLREQGVVRACAHVVARTINRAALTNDDVAGQNFLTAELLDTEPLVL